MIFSMVFIILNTFFIAIEKYWFMLVPVALLVIVTAFVALDVLVMIIVFFTPLSVILQENDFGTAISIPTEPLLLGVTIIYILRLFYESKVEKRIFFHPITVAIFFYLFWIFFTSLTSTLPGVSFKFLLSRLWLIVPFYFIALRLFKEKKNMKIYLWLYMISFSIVIIYTLFNHALAGFSEKESHVAMNPFYNDHTSYGALLAMYLPPLLFFCFDKDSLISQRLFAVFLLIIFITGLIFSYTRAAWLSIFCAVVVLAIYLLKIRLVPILALIGVLIALFFMYEKDIMIRLESSRHKNTKNKDIEQRLKSIANVTTDASNTERFNRWSSAIRMFKEKPWLGWGPGTYQFKYGSYQISTEKTSISTNSGERGNAHSEYIGPLAETGVIGLLSFIGIIVATLLTAAKLIYHSKNRKTRIFAMTLMLGLITYFVHGTLNNFLDTDKASVPFWGFMAMLVMLDVNERNEEEIEEKRI